MRERCHCVHIGADSSRDSRQAAEGVAEGGGPVIMGKNELVNEGRAIMVSKATEGFEEQDEAFVL